MMRTVCIICALFALFCIFPCGLEYDVSSQLSPYLPSGIDGEFDEIAENTANGGIFEKIKAAASGALPDIFGSFGALLCAVLLSGVSGAVSSSLGGEDVSVTAGIAVCAVLVFAVIKTSFDALHTALLASVTFMTALMGIMCYVYGIMGNAAAMGVSASVLAAVLQAVQMTASYILFPLVGTVFGLTLAGSLREGNELSAISSFVKRTAVFILSACGAAVTLALTLSGVFASVSEGVLKKSVKFASGTFIPIIGSSLAEAYDAVFSSINVIKATAGGGGIGALLLIFAPPFATLCTTKLLFVCAGALSGSLGVPAQKRLFDGCSDILTVMIAVCAFSSAVMVIACAVFMRVGI